MRPFSLLVLAGSSLLLYASAAAAAPRVTLALERATLSETLAALERATGWRFLVEGRPPSPGTGELRCRFAWSSTTLAAASREVGEAFHLRPVLRGERTVDFVPGRLSAARSPYRIDVAGFALVPIEIRARTERIAYADEPEPRVSRTGALLLLVRAITADPDTAAGLRNVRISPDRGAPRVAFPILQPWEAAPDLAPGDLQILIPLGWLAESARVVRRIEGQLVLRGGGVEERAVPFAFEYLPLPGENDAVTPAPAAGKIECPIRFRGLPKNGELALGLSRKSGRGWGPLRWHTLSVAAGRPPVLEGVAPGTYRIERRLQLRAPGGGLRPAPRREPDGPVEITVAAGKTVRLPVLQAD